ncbi:MAG: gephyrin-like molybdotransferase Glp [Pseudomonadota bacterium]
MTIIERIEHQGCGCDSLSQDQLLSVDEALGLIDRNVRPIDGAETVALHCAQGRVLVEAVRARGMVPPFDNAAMDGYAIHTSHLVGAGPWDLQVVDRIAAGQAPSERMARDTAVQIFTGAPVPDAANAVVMQEDVQKTATGIRLTKPVCPRTHIRTAGEDVMPGKITVPAGRKLTAREIAACAAAGHNHLTVWRALRVALLITGDEVCQVGLPRGAAGIWDVNTPLLQAAVASPAVEICAVHHAADTQNALRQQIATLAGMVDLIITTGGISVGEEDHVKPALAELGASITFSGVALKPGKPVSFGQVKGANWLGLPGNPLSAYVTWQLFGNTLCQALTGETCTHPIRRHVVLSNTLHHRPGRCEMRLARLCGHDHLGRECVSFASASHSGRVANLPEMDGLLFIPAEVDKLPAGALVEFQPF